MHDDVEAAYDRWSGTYDTQENPTRDLDALVLPRIAPPLAGKVVVEAGCGTGKNSIWLAARCRSLLGLDFSEGMLSQARTKVESLRANFVRCDILEDWPLAGGVADIVFFNLVLEHIKVLLPVLAQAVRVMRHDGWLIISEFHPDRVARGQGARIEAVPEGSGAQRIVSYLHRLDDYQAVGEMLGLTLDAVDEWSKEMLVSDRQPGTATEPLLLSLCFRKRS